MPNRKIFFDQPIETTTESITCTGSVITPNPGIVLPFASGGGTISLTTNSTGNSSNIMVLGFGNYNSTGLTLTNGAFSQTATRVYSFVMPYDATLNSIFMETVLSSNWTPTGTGGIIQYYPYIAIATAPQGSNTFTILSDTMTQITNPFLGGTTYTANTIRAGSLTNLGIPLATGTKVAIVAGLTTQGTGTLNQSSSYLYFTGGLWFT